MLLVHYFKWFPWPPSLHFSSTQIGLASLLISSWSVPRLWLELLQNRNFFLPMFQEIQNSACWEHCLARHSEPVPSQAPQEVVMGIRQMHLKILNGQTRWHGKGQVSFKEEVFQVPKAGRSMWLGLGWGTSTGVEVQMVWSTCQGKSRRKPCFGSLALAPDSIFIGRHAFTLMPPTCSPPRYAFLHRPDPKGIFLSNTNPNISLFYSSPFYQSPTQQWEGDPGISWWNPVSELRMTRAVIPRHRSGALAGRHSSMDSPRRNGPPWYCLLVFVMAVFPPWLISSSKMTLLNTELKQDAWLAP